MSEQYPNRGAGGPAPGQFNQPPGAPRTFVPAPHQQQLGQSPGGAPSWDNQHALPRPQQQFGQQPPGPYAVQVKPIHRRPWFIVLALLLGLGVLSQLVGGGDDTQNATAPAASTAPAPETEQAPPAEAEPTAPEAEAPVPPVEPPAALQSDIERRYGTFEPVSYEGYGAQVIDLPGEHGIVTATAGGSSNFIVNVLDENYEPTGDLLVNTIGAYQGTSLYGEGFRTAAVLEVTADGPWSITINPVAAAPEITLPGEGVGDEVFLYGGGSGAWTFTHNGQSNFVVQSYGNGIMPLLINEIGPYSGQIPMRKGPAVIAVTADGWWSVTP